MKFSATPARDGTIGASCGKRLDIGAHRQIFRLGKNLLALA